MPGSVHQESPRLREAQLIETLRIEFLQMLLNQRVVIRIHARKDMMFGMVREVEVQAVNDLWDFQCDAVGQRIVGACHPAGHVIGIDISDNDAVANPDG
jgi:hypothetical protein